MSSNKLVRSKSHRGGTKAAEKLKILEELAQLHQDNYPDPDSSYYAEEDPSLMRCSLRTYLEAADCLLNKLGPDYNEEVTLKFIRGMKDGLIKQTLLMMMYDKDMEFEIVSDILMAGMEYVSPFQRQDAGCQ